jgi:hypothetical protein
VTVRLQEGLVLVDTDPGRSVRPSAYFTEISRVGFQPVEMEIVATGEFEDGAFVVDGGRWPVAGAATPGPGRRTVRLKVADGAADPPRVIHTEPDPDHQHRREL